MIEPAPRLLDEVEALLDLRMDLVENPYPLYARMRAEAPVLICKSVVAVSRAAEIEAIIRDPIAYSNFQGGGSRVDEALARLSPASAAALREDLHFLDGWMNHMDAPGHTRLRSFAHRVFTARRVADMRPTIQEITDGLLDVGAEKGVIDAIDDFFYEMPLLVIGQMLGASPEDRADVRRWSEAIAPHFGAKYTEESVAHLHASLTEFRDYLTGLIEERRIKPHTDLLAALVQPTEAGDRLTLEELQSMFQVMLFAGHETTTGMLGTVLHTLLTHRDQFALLRDDPSLLRPAVEECIRYDGSAQDIRRMATQTTTLAGVEIPAGSTIRLFLGAANRDPDRFPDPDRFDILRDDDAKHLGFGVGPHYCLGQALARLEIEVAIGSLIERFPEMEIAGPVEWKSNVTLRGPRRFPLALGKPVSARR